MHIPDGYLGPQTYVPAFAVMVAFWSAGIAKVKKTLRLKQAHHYERPSRVLFHQYQPRGE